MGRKIKLEERNENVINDPHSPLISPNSREENPLEINAFNLIHFLTREHLKEMIKEHDVISFKHAGVLNLPEVIQFCRDSDVEEMSRFEKLKQCYLALSKYRYEESKKTSYGRRKSRSSTAKKNIDTDPEMRDFIKNDMFENVKKLHELNKEVFCGDNTYTMVGFNKFRYDQCPNVHVSSSLFENGQIPNRLLHEAMLSLDITEENMISGYVEEKEIRILSFDLKQEIDSVKFYITIPRILEHKTCDFTLDCTETGIHFYVEDHNGKNYIFEIGNFANKINRDNATYLILENDTVTILVEKKKRGMWKHLFFYKHQTKALWYAEIKSLSRIINPDIQEQKEALDFVWNVALILVNCRANLLNLPKDLNPVKLRFSNIDEMIYYYKTIIPSNRDLKALIYFYGGALLFKLMKSTSSKLETTANENALSKHVTDMLGKMRKELECRKNYEKGLSLKFEGKYKEAYSYFRKDSIFCSIPRTFMMKGICLLEMGREKEAIMDSIFVLRNLDQYSGFPALLNILEYKIRCGHVIHAIDMAISLEFNHRSIDESDKKALQGIKQRGLYYLNNIFKSHSLIFQKKYKEAIPFLEKAESIVSIKSGLTSIILLLLYFISKNYENVFILGDEIFKKQEKYLKLAIYLYAMSKFYTKQLHSAMKNFEKIEISCWREYTRVTLLNGLIFDADASMKKRKMPKFLAWYYRNALLLAKDNEQMLGHIWTKLGVLNYWHNNLVEAVKCLDLAIQFTGEICTHNFLCILILRSVACDKLGMVKEAKEDRRAVRKIYFEVFKRTPEGKPYEKEISIVQTFFSW